MLHSNTLKIPCESCGQVNIYPHHYIINAELHPDLKEAILNDEFFTYECAHCHHRNTYYHALNYYDPQKHLFLGFDASSESFMHLVSLLRQGGKLKHTTIRFTDSFLSFKEIIRIRDANRDDRLIALYKDLLLEQFKAKYPDCGKVMALYSSSPESESIIVFSDRYAPKVYPLSQRWYDAQVHNKLLQHILHYDTTIIISKAYIDRLRQLDLSAIMARITTKDGNLEAVVNLSDHIHIGDHVTFKKDRQMDEGIVIHIMAKSIKEIAPMTPVIESVSPFISNEDKRYASQLENLFNSQFQQAPDLSCIFTLLEHCPLYIPMSEHEGLLSFETLDDQADGFSFIPIFTSRDDIMAVYGEEYMIIRDCFYDLVHQKITPVDGYLLNPFSRNLFPIDHHLLTLFDEFTSQEHILN